jgi:hypothetical protein
MRQCPGSWAPRYPHNVGGSAKPDARLRQPRIRAHQSLSLTGVLRKKKCPKVETLHRIIQSCAAGGTPFFGWPLRGKGVPLRSQTSADGPSHPKTPGTDLHPGVCRPAPMRREIAGSAGPPGHRRTHHQTPRMDAKLPPARGLCDRVLPTADLGLHGSRVGEVSDERPRSIQPQCNARSVPSYSPSTSMTPSTMRSDTRRFNSPLQTAGSSWRRHQTRRWRANPDGDGTPLVAYGWPGSPLFNGTCHLAASGQGARGDPTFGQDPPRRRRSGIRA